MSSDDSKQGIIEERKYVFCLFVAGLTPRSQLALSRLKGICEHYLQGKYELEVVDIYQQPNLAKAAQIVAVPTLLQKYPPPLRKFIGDISQPERFLSAIGVKPEEVLSQRR